MKKLILLLLFIPLVSCDMSEENVVEQEEQNLYTLIVHNTNATFQALEIFKRTGSLTKLQRAMGHSSLQVSLTYLRGLEVTELKEEDMPMV